VKKTLVACTALSITILMVQFVSAAGEDSIYGYISCAKCAAKGATSSHRDCMEKCVAKGAGVVLVTDDDHKVIPIENPDAVSGHYGHRVALDGYMNGDAFHVIRLRII
jgi:hypothetical protein